MAEEYTEDQRGKLQSIVQQFIEHLYNVPPSPDELDSMTEVKTSLKLSRIYDGDGEVNSLVYRARIEILK